MSKTLVANPVWGLKGIPTRIILDKKSLTIKNGIIGGKSMPYNSISSVEFQAVNSLTLAGTITIIPYRGAEVKANGFYKGEFKKVKQAVEDGYFDDSNDSGEDNYQQYENNSGSSQNSNFVEQSSPQRPLQEVDINDENSLTNALNSIISTIDAPGAIDVSVKESSLAKYNNYLGMLKASYPNNKLIPFFQRKILEWKQKDKEHTKMLFKYLIYMAIAFVVLFFITTRCMH
jgi:hypothetical protein